MDLGNAALRQCVRSGLPVQGVKHLLLSHLHPDHTGDLVPYLFARNYAPPPWDAVPDLTVYGPEGTRHLIETLFLAWPSLEPKEGKGQVEVVEFAPEGGLFLEQGEFRIQAFPVEHGDMTAFAFRVSDGTVSLAYSGDSKLCAGVKEVARAADLFICECSCFPRGCEPLYCREVHLSWEDVAEICQASLPQKVVLTHLYEPVLRERPNPLESLREKLDIPVVLAEDGLRFSL